ncbi:hypothetical protein OG321_36520 [Streptomyces sp. NBC_00424]|uniref:hypothetical protein n=1 Tax=Streptomyces sp. NBC_00424 TaxID=2903648 RepID=UPI002255E979|nr:hypothetical protein [Streptomyces sp. NBC_00424]MCX5077957.1 hypothetical protein [Streptomyces sp. NBC_00424]
MKSGEQLSFAGRLGTDFKVDKVTGFVIPGHGISFTTQPDSLGKFGRVGVPVDASSIPNGLEIVQVGKPGHYELAVKPGVNMTPDEFQGKFGAVRPVAGCP